MMYRSGCSSWSGYSSWSGCSSSRSTAHATRSFERAGPGGEVDSRGSGASTESGAGVRGSVRAGRDGDGARYGKSRVGGEIGT